MKIVFFANPCGLHKELKVPNGQMLICCGNFTKDLSRESLQDFLTWFSKLPHPIKLLVPGETDYAFDNIHHPLITVEYQDLLYNFFQDTRLNAILTCGNRVLGGVPFAVSSFSRCQEGAFRLPNAGCARTHWNALKDSKILVTYQTPFSICDKDEYRKPVGDINLLEKLRNLNFKLHLFGSVSSSRGILQTETAVFVNGSVTHNGELIGNPISILYNDENIEIYND